MRGLRERVERNIAVFKVSAGRLGYPVALTAILSGLLRPIGIECYYGVVLFADSLATEAGRSGCYETRFLTPAEVPRIAREQTGLFTPEFARRAIARGDRCYGVFDQGRLISYAWYSSLPTPCETGFEIYFDPQFHYGYKAYTIRERRGEHLYALGITNGTRDGAVEGRKGTVAYVEAENVPMLITSKRLGSTTFGSLCIVRLGAFAFSLRSRGCRRFGFGFRPAPRRAEFFGTSKQARGA